MRIGRDRDAKFDISTTHRLVTQLRTQERDLISCVVGVTTNAQSADEVVLHPVQEVTVTTQVPPGTERFGTDGELAVTRVERVLIVVVVAIQTEDSVQTLDIPATDQPRVHANLRAIGDDQSRIRCDERILVQPERRKTADLAETIPVADSVTRLVTDVKVGSL